MSRFNVCNLIELLTQLALVFAGASPHSRDNSVLTTMQSFEEVSPQHSVIEQFSRILRINHHHHHIIISS